MLDNNFNMFNNDNAKGKPLKTFILTVRLNITNLLYTQYFYLKRLFLFVLYLKVCMKINVKDLYI